MTRANTLEEVPLREAKANLSQLTKRAKGGVRVVITNHGTPIADLVRHGETASTVVHLKRPGSLPKPVKLKGDGPTTTELLHADREF